MIYLDWASTSLPDRHVLADGADIASDFPGNPSSLHALGRAAKAKLEEARSGILAALGPQKAGAKLVFTGSGSEADAIPLLSLARKASKDGSKPHILVSAIEHAAIYEQLPVLKRFGIETSLIRPAADGCLQAESFGSALRPETEAVFVMALNNETGAIQPIAEIARAVSERAAKIGRRKPRIHVDAIQALGKTSFEPASLGIDSVAFSAHKIRGPRGIGALWMARDLEPLILGGGQEGGIRPGTESLQAAWAFRSCLDKAMASLPARIEAGRALEHRLFEGLLDMGAIPLPLGRRPGDDRYSPFILSVAFPGLSGEVFVRILSEGCPEAPEGIAVSTGSACSHNARNKGRRVLEAMGLPDELAFSSIRVSTGELTGPDDIDAFLAAALSLYKAYRA
ncbi:MAG TPA: cysteine desulfurase family protein [Rectinemataceae bacterium]|nr:cysteine desulfurase family protein [Rectinemataceae bacterium]